LPQPQDRRLDPLRFDDPSLRHYDEYTYTSLVQDKKMIRLMKLYPGETVGLKIFCELIDVEYDKKFHIPTKIQEAEAQDGKDQSSDSTSRGKEDDGYRSDLETRWQEKIETKEEELAREKRQEHLLLKKQALYLMKNDQDKNAKEEEVEEQFQKWKEVKKNEQPYEALSWCWGQAEEDYAVLIKKGETTFRKRVRRELALALKYLRRPDKERFLWIDAICINQASPNERNHQVQMMSRVYTRAQQVCIWLGEADAASETAIRFINNEMK